MEKMSSWERLEPEVELPVEVKRKIQQSVQDRLSLLKLFGGVVDLYVGKAGRTIVELADTFQDPADMASDNVKKPKESK